MLLQTLIKITFFTCNDNACWYKEVVFILLYSLASVALFVHMGKCDLLTNNRHMLFADTYIINFAMEKTHKQLQVCQLILLLLLRDVQIVHCIWISVATK